MIQISQEELFRSIEREHAVKQQQADKKLQKTDVLIDRLNNNTNFKFKTDGADRNERPVNRLAARSNSVASSSFFSESSSPSSSSSTSSTWPLTKQHMQEMASILPQNTYGSLAKDPNNNSAPCDEDEVQAVLITGCGSKIGSNIAVAFAARGLKVALVDFDIKQTQAVARECQDKSPKNRVPLQIVADISQLAEAHKVIDRTIEAFGRLDVLVNTVNNASLMEAKFNSGDDDPHVFEQYHKIIASNMHSVTYLCISAAPYLRKSKGSIVNVSSITNNETGSYKFAYCMSKAGISTLTKCLATDLAPDIKVICVSPKADS